MKIYIAHFGHLYSGKVPHNIVPIAVVPNAPDWYKGKKYKKLFPPISEELTSSEFMDDIRKIANGKDVYLVIDSKNWSNWKDVEAIRWIDNHLSMEDFYGKKE